MTNWIVSAARAVANSWAGRKKRRKAPVKKGGHHRHTIIEPLEARNLLSITALGDSYSVVQGASLVVSAAQGVLANDVAPLYAPQNLDDPENYAFDLLDGFIMVPKPADDQGETAATVRSLIIQGMGNGDWNSTSGIYSTIAAATYNDHGGAIGFADASDLGLSPGDTYHGALIPENGAVIARYTYLGDANLDGRVDDTNSDDYDRWCDGYADVRPNTWVYGDFDYSGDVDDGTDLSSYTYGFSGQDEPVTSPACKNFALDIHDGFAAFPKPAGDTGETEAAVRALIIEGRGHDFGVNCPAWDGKTGLYSTAAETNALCDQTAAIGFADAADLDLSPGDTYQGLVVPQNGAVFARYCYLGDSNLDGVVDDADDLDRYNWGYENETPNKWAYGDFDYSGVVDDSYDNQSFQYGYSFQGAPLDGPGFEPWMTAEVLSGPSAGTLTVWQSDGSFTYDYAGSPTGTDSFTYKATDPFTHAESTATVNLRLADPSLLAAAREALALSPDANVTPDDWARLTTLSADSNQVQSLEGLQFAANLESLVLVPGDFSAPGHLTTLARLSGLSHLRSLTLQGCGLNNAALGTLPTDLTALETLDVRYNNVTEVPTNLSPAANWPNLSELYVYGNPLTETPRTGLASLTGRPVNVDLPPDHPERAQTISELAAALYKLPVKMYEYVLNTIEFQPYTGAMKGPLAVLQTKAGNDWDTDSLLAEMFSAAGIATQFVPGRINAPIQAVEDYVGAFNPNGAEQVLNAAGLSAARLADLGQTVSVSFDHVWMKAELPIGSNQWVAIDPSWKLRTHAPKVRNMLAEVGFDTDPDNDPEPNDYFSSTRKELPDEYYESQVRTHLAETEAQTSVADIRYGGVVIPEAVTVLPSALPYSVVSSSSGVGTIPPNKTHRVRISLLNGAKTTTYFQSNILGLPDISLLPLTVRPTPASGDQVLPELLLNWQTDAQSPFDLLASSAPVPLGKTAAVVLRLEHFNADGNDTVDHTLEFPRQAGQYMAVALDANQISTELVVDQQRAVNLAAVAYANNPQSLDLDANIGGLLHLAGLKFYHDTDRAEQAICDLTAAQPQWNYVASGITTSSTTIQTLAPELQGNLQFPCLPSELKIDVPHGSWSAVPVDGSTTYNSTRHRMLGYVNSAMEHAIWEELTNIPTMSTVKSLQLARQHQPSAIPIFTINSVNSAQLIPQLTHSQGIKEAVQSEVNAGSMVIIPRDPTPLGDWDGVGYIAENSSYTGYIISGGLSGGMQETIQGGYTTGTPQAVLPPVVETVQLGTQGFAGDPINLATGSVWHDETDFIFPGLGTTLGLARHYASDQTGSLSYNSDRGMSPGWSFTYSDRLEDVPNSTTKVWYTSAGDRLPFELEGGAYVTPDSVYGHLDFNGVGQGYTWTDKTGNTVKFDDSGRLTRVADRYGNGVSLTYYSSSVTVRDLFDSSRYLTFTYTGSHVTSVADFTGRTWTYDYDANGRLDSVTAPSAPQTLQAVVGYEYYTDTVRSGLLKKVTDPDGNVTQYFYYANRRGFEVTDAEGASHSLSYNLFRDRTLFVDERDSATSYDYNSEGNIVLELYDDHTAVTRGWQDGLKQWEKEAFGQPESYLYNDDGKLTQLTDREGHVTSYDYEVHGDFSDLWKVTRLADLPVQDRIVTTYEYRDSAGKYSLRRVTDALGNITSYTYPDEQSSPTANRGLPLSVTAPKGVLTTGDSDDYKTTYTYNIAGQVMSRTSRVSSTESITQTSTYDNRGNLTSSTDGNGNVTTYTYDLLGRRKTQTLPDPDDLGGTNGPLPSPVTTFEYTRAGKLTSTAEATTGTRQRTSTSAYDDMGRVIKTANPDGTYRTVHYDAAGNLVAATDAMGNVAQSVYDGRNRPIAILQADGAAVRTTYDGGGRVVGLTDARGNTTRYEYDKLGRKTAELLPYDDTSKAMTIDDGDAGFSTSGSWTPGAPGYGNDCRTVQNAPSASATWQFTLPSGYAPGRYYEVLVTWLSFQGTVAAAPYTVHDGPAGSPTSWACPVDQTQRPPSIEEFRDRGWLSLGRFPITGDTLTVRLSGVSSGLVVADAVRIIEVSQTNYAYDAQGNLQYVTVNAPVDAVGAEGRTTEYTYDALGRKRSEILPDPDGPAEPLARPTTYYQYDANGNLQYVTDARGGSEGDPAHTVQYTYNELDRKTAQTLPDPDGAAPYDTLTTRYEYDGNGNLRYVVNPLGTQHSQTEYTTEYQYDRLGRKLAVIGPDPDGAGSLGRPTTSYAYDAEGNLISVTDPRGAVTYTAYDLLGRAIAVTDALGEYAGDPSHTTSVIYDAVGNALVTTDALGRSVVSQYDAVGRKVRQTLPLPAPLPPEQTEPANAPQTTWQYDAGGNLTATIDPLGRVSRTQYDNFNRVVAQIAPYAEPSPTSQADDGGAGWSSSGTWTPDSGGSGGDHRYAVGVGNSATWTFQPTRGRYYEVLVNWAANPANSAAAPYTVYDGTTASTRYWRSWVDQVDAPPEHPVFAGNGWMSLGIFWMGSDTLTIQLSGVDGARVDADAVKIIEVSPALSAYDALGNLASVTDALGRTTQYMHDNLGRTIQQIAPDPDDYTASGGTNQGLTSPVTSYAYDAKGNLTATTDPLGYTTRTQYDGLDRPTVVTDALGRSPGDPQHSTVTAYDALGRVTAVTDPLGRTINYQYDNLGRKTAQLLPDPDGIGQDRPTTYYGYDPNGNLKYVTDPLGSAPGDSDHTTWYFYDALNRPTCVVDALANATYPMDGPAPSPSRRTAC